jgi:hypothetical protein
VTAEHRARGRTDDDLVRLRQCLQARRQVRRLADDRGLRRGSFADLIADDHRSRGDADPHRELDPRRPANCGIQLRHRIDDIETRPHRTLGLVLMGARVAEINEDAVAHVLGDKAVVAPDRRAAAVLIRRDHIAQIFGVHPGGECRRSHQVAKHHGQLAALGLGWHRCRCRYQGWGRRRSAERGDGGKEPCGDGRPRSRRWRSGPQPSGPAGRLRRHRCRGTPARIEQDRAVVANLRHRSPSQVPFMRETQLPPLPPRSQ